MEEGVKQLLASESLRQIIKESVKGILEESSVLAS